MFEVLNALHLIGAFRLYEEVRVYSKGGYILRGVFEDSKAQIRITVTPKVTHCQIDSYEASYRWNGKFWENVVTRELFYSFNLTELL